HRSDCQRMSRRSGTRFADKDVRQQSERRLKLLVLTRFLQRVFFTTRYFARKRISADWSFTPGSLHVSTAISTLGGVGLFLLGMTVMTEGLKALAGSALRTVLSKAAATPLHGSFWGAIVTLLVQSSSATTMTTIGLVSAGLLTFQQGLGLVFGANIGTTGTGWLVALICGRVSLTAAALPMIFVGALTKLLARGRISGVGGALA